jgi:flagellar assembly protein FliH
MTTARKFAFDTVFSPSGEILAQSAERDHRFNAAELEKIRQDAFAQGHAAASAEAQARQVQAVQRIGSELSRIGADLSTQHRAVQEHGAALALHIGRKLAGHALEHFGGARIEEIVRQTLETIVDAPRVTITLPTGAAQDLKPLIDRAAQEVGFYGVVLVREHPAARQGDVTIDWGEAGLSWDSAALDAQIAAALAAIIPDRS